MQKKDQERLENLAEEAQQPMRASPLLQPTEIQIPTTEKPWVTTFRVYTSVKTFIEVAHNIPIRLSPTSVLAWEQAITRTRPDLVCALLIPFFFDYALSAGTCRRPDLQTA